MFDFTEFDKKVDSAALAQEVKEAPDFADVKKGDYIVSLEKMELTVTKQDQKPMFAAQFKIKEGDNKGRMLFFNRVIYGNKNTDKWNDGRAIKSVSATFLPETNTAPSSGARRPLISRRAVVLPQPERPIMVRNSPRYTVRLKSCRTMCSP